MTSARSSSWTRIAAASSSSTASSPPRRYAHSTMAMDVVRTHMWSAVSTSSQLTCAIKLRNSFGIAACTCGQSDGREAMALTSSLPGVKSVASSASDCDSVTGDSAEGTHEYGIASHFRRVSRSQALGMCVTASKISSASVTRRRQKSAASTRTVYMRPSTTSCRSNVRRAYSSELSLSISSGSASSRVLRIATRSSAEIARARRERISGYAEMTRLRRKKLDSKVLRSIALSSDCSSPPSTSSDPTRPQFSALYLHNSPSSVNVLSRRRCAGVRSVGPGWRRGNKRLTSDGSIHDRRDWATQRSETQKLRMKASRPKHMRFSTHTSSSYAVRCFATRSASARRFSATSVRRSRTHSSMSWASQYSCSSRISSILRSVGGSCVWLSGAASESLSLSASSGAGASTARAGLRDPSNISGKMVRSFGSRPYWHITDHARRWYAVHRSVFSTKSISDCAL
mmetsp:Transcript_24662/g.76280  ORF Transcript_24662/g.76280 Transcript_24662/m.76280 type:complete len:457 (-) Transcript_24662:852-2222(-)